jgi:hypothetical protein
MKERDLLEESCSELGPVVFPAYADTSVGVRSRQILAMLEDPATRHDLAQALLTPRNEWPDDEPDVEVEVLPDPIGAADGTPDGEAVMPSEPAPRHSTHTHLALVARAKLAGVI